MSKPGKSVILGRLPNTTQRPRKADVVLARSGKGPFAFRQATLAFFAAMGGMVVASRSELALPMLSCELLPWSRGPGVLPVPKLWEAKSCPTRFEPFQKGPS